MIKYLNFSIKLISNNLHFLAIYDSFLSNQKAKKLDFTVFTLLYIIMIIDVN